MYRPTSTNETIVVSKKDFELMHKSLDHLLNYCSMLEKQLGVKTKSPPKKP